jgi:secreted Zn-dependent insulinase-like peptidase
LINHLLNGLTPEHSYTTFVSQVHKQNEAADKFEIEEIYGTEFTREKYSSSFIYSLSSASSQKGETLGFPPPNDFVPNQSPVEKKADHATNSTNPVLIRGNDSDSDLSKVWFRQDDKFD